MWSFPTTKSEHILAVDRAEGNLTVEEDYCSRLEKTLDYYTREKRLLLSALFLVGSFDVPSFGGTTRRKNIKCPLFNFPCELTEREFRSGSVFVDYSRGSINPAATQILEHHEVNIDNVVLPLLALFGRPESVPALGGNLATMIAKLANAVEQSSSGAMEMHASCYLSIEPKQASARGSLYELEILSKSRFFSEPLQAILKEMSSTTLPFWSNLAKYWPFQKFTIPLPEVLSSAQSQALDSAQAYPLSVVSGPPGTGKSFTIACLALKEFSKGKSVLVVSQNQHAVDVVRRKLIDQMGVESGLTVLGSEKGVSPDMKVQITSMLRNHRSGHKSARELSKSLTRLMAKRDSLEREFHSHINSLGMTSSSAPQRTSSELTRNFWLFGNKEHESSELPLSEKFVQLEELDQQIRNLVIELMSVHHTDTSKRLSRDWKSRKSLQAFAKSLTARNEHYQERYYQDVDFEHVLKAIPFWFSSVGNLNRLLPLQAEMFDLVVIDEATQCNMSICLPALQRAKRAVIVGDPKQLRHVSFVSYDLQQRLAKVHQLNVTKISDNFRSDSVLDYAQSALELGQQSTLLDEHFRSHPQIIGFSNHEFYDGSLKIMTERPSNRRHSIDVIKVKAGRRLRKGVNKKEAEAVLTKLKSIIEEQRDFPEANVHTLGILAFFSAQASHIEKMIFDHINLKDMRRHNIRVGSPFSFQGEERDHMLISCSVDDKTPGGAYNYLNRNDVFNVAITRARDYQTVFISCDIEHLKTGSKLIKYLSYARDYQHQEFEHSDLSVDSFQNEICHWLSKHGVEIYKNYLVAGINIDIMAVYHGHAIAVDLIGFDGQLTGALSLTQFKLLKRAGLDSFLLPYQEWKQDSDRVLQALLLQLGVVQKLSEAYTPLDKFNDEQEQEFSAITDGLSINQLNGRFLRNNEVLASEQLAGLVQRYNQFITLLAANFIPQELTYRRYSNALNELIQYCVNNLQKASVASELANGLFEQQKTLFGENHLNNSSQSELEDGYYDVINARLSMAEEQRTKFINYINDNHQALLQIDRTMIKLNDLNDNTRDIDPVEALQELTTRLDLYRGKTLT